MSLYDVVFTVRVAGVVGVIVVKTFDGSGVFIWEWARYSQAFHQQVCRLQQVSQERQDTWWGNVARVVLTWGMRGRGKTDVCCAGFQFGVREWVHGAIEDDDCTVSVDTHHEFVSCSVLTWVCGSRLGHDTCSESKLFSQWCMFFWWLLLNWSIDYPAPPR